MQNASVTTLLQQVAFKLGANSPHAEALNEVASAMQNRPKAASAVLHPVQQASQKALRAVEQAQGKLSNAKQHLNSLLEKLEKQEAEVDRLEVELESARADSDAAAKAELEALEQIKRNQISEDLGNQDRPVPMEGIGEPAAAQATVDSLSPAKKQELLQILLGDPEAQGNSVTIASNASRKETAAEETAQASDELDCPESWGQAPHVVGDDRVCPYNLGASPSNNRIGEVKARVKSKIDSAGSATASGIGTPTSGG